MGVGNNTKGQTQNHNRLIPVEGFATLDLTVGYTIKKWSLPAKVSNPTNTLNAGVFAKARLRSTNA
jgi:iron complex outermembrane recepter protein